VTYTVHIGREGLGALRPQWDALAQRSPGHVFQTTGFVDAWASTVGAHTGATPLVVTREQADGVVTALFPACIVPFGPARLITWLGGPHVLDYGDILHDSTTCDVSAVQFVADALPLLRQSARGAFLYLTNVRRDATCRDALGTHMRHFKRSVAPYVALEGSLDDYLRTLSRNRRHNLARIERKLARRGEARFELLRAADSGFEQVVAQILALQKQRFAQQRSNAPIFEPCYEQFRLEHATHDGGIIAARLSLDGQLVAGSLQCVYAGRMYYLVTAFNEDFADVAPGKLLVRYLLEYCYDNNLGVFDFCWGDEAYKYLWTDRQVELDTFVSDDFAGRTLTSVAGLRRRLTGYRAIASPAPAE
jgi:CelD/BcsL family acetyltransferase involved in cellulose biosynthesis